MPTAFLTYLPGQGDRQGAEHTYRGPPAVLPTPKSNGMKDEAAANADADAREKERIDKLQPGRRRLCSRQRSSSANSATRFLPTSALPSRLQLPNSKRLTRLEDIAAIDAAIKEIETTFGAAQQDIYSMLSGHYTSRCRQHQSRRRLARRRRPSDRRRLRRSEVKVH